jgi:hypothetical protein
MRAISHIEVRATAGTVDTLCGLIAAAILLVLAGSAIMFAAFGFLIFSGGKKRTWTFYRRSRRRRPIWRYRNLGD